MTARELLIALSAADCTPRVEGEELAFDRKPPANLLPYVELLHTGVRAVLTGRAWYGIASPRGKDGRGCGLGCGRGCGPWLDGAMNPADEIPPSAALLTVAGDSDWDRIRPGTIEKLPDAFREPTAKPKTSFAGAKR